MFSKEFWLGDNGALARGIRTFAQTAGAAITVEAFTPYSLGSWVGVLVTGGMSALYSIFMSLDRGGGKSQSVELSPLVANGHYVEPVLVGEPVFSARPSTFVGCGDDLR